MPLSFGHSSKICWRVCSGLRFRCRIRPLRGVGRGACNVELPRSPRRRTSAKPNSRKFAVTKSRPSRRGSALGCSPAALSPPETSKIDTPVTAKSGKQARVRTSELPENFSLIGGPRRPGSSRVKLWLSKHNTSQNALPLLRRFWFVWAGAITKNSAIA